MKRALALLALVACGGSQRADKQPVVTPIAHVHFDDDFGLIFVTAFVAGAPRTLLFDSGADHMLLDPGVTAGSDVDMFIGPVPVNAHAVQVVSLHDFERTIGRPIDGIVGYDLLARYVVTIDYAAQELAFYDPKQAPTTGDAVPVMLQDRGALVDVTLHDGADVVDASVKVDTGSTDTLRLTASFVADHHLLASVPSVARPVGGVADGRIAKLSAIRLGSATLGPLVIGYADDHLPHAYAGTLGAELLRQFTVTFDYPHQRLLLAGRERPPALTVDGSGLDIATFPDDFKRCQITAVVADSPAANAGIDAGDEIVAINGTPFSDLGLATLWSLLRQQGTLHLTIRHAGGERVATVRLRPLV